MSSQTGTLTQRGLIWHAYYVWRLFATGLSFLVFAIGGAGIATLMATIFCLIPRRLICRRVAMRRVLSYTFHIYIRMLCWLQLMTFEVQGAEHIAKGGHFIVANHPSLLDVVLLMSLVRNADCIVREGLRNNPLTALPVRVAGYLRNESGSLLELAVASIKQGNSLILFPEGTRSKPDQPLKLCRGAANIALCARKNLTPIIITCEPATLLKHQKWYQIPDSPPHFTVRVLPELQLAEIVSPDQMQSKAARVVTRQLTELYERELAVSKRMFYADK